jgi:hypothetical protein
MPLSYQILFPLPIPVQNIDGHSTPRCTLATDIAAAILSSKEERDEQDRVNIAG